MHICKNRPVCAAKLQEAQGIYPHRYHDLACRPGFSDNNGMSVHRHHQGSLCTVGRLQQLRYEEDIAINRNVR